MKNRMGTFYTSCRLENHVDRRKSAEIPRLLVDTGSEFTWIDGDTLKKIGVTREEKNCTFVLENGRRITRAVGFAVIHVGDTFTVDEVVFAGPGDLQLLGARSLEGLSLRIDPRSQKLVAGGPILAAGLAAMEAAPQR